MCFTIRLNQIQFNHATEEFDVFYNQMNQIKFKHATEEYDVFYNQIESNKIQTCH